MINTYCVLKRKRRNWFNLEIAFKYPHSICVLAQLLESSIVFWPLQCKTVQSNIPNTPHWNKSASFKQAQTDLARIKYFYFFSYMTETGTHSRLQNTLSLTGWYLFCAVSFPSAAGCIPLLAPQLVSFGSRTLTGLAISHLCAGYNHTRHTDVILTGQE